MIVLPTFSVALILSAAWFYAAGTTEFLGISVYKLSMAAVAIATFIAMTQRDFKSSFFVILSIILFRTVIGWELWGTQYPILFQSALNLFTALAIAIVATDRSTAIIAGLFFLNFIFGVAEWQAWLPDRGNTFVAISYPDFLAAINYMALFLLSGENHDIGRIIRRNLVNSRHMGHPGSSRIADSNLHSKEN